MMTAAGPPAGSRAPATGDGERLVRDVLFLATFLLTWITLSPFPDLREPASYGALSAGNVATQAATLLLTGALAAFAICKRTSLLLRVVTPSLVITLAWFGLSAVLSAYADVSMRRLLLAMLTIFQASELLLVPNGREHFARLLAVGAIVVLAACYIGVAYFPEYSIHQITDFSEPELAGDWRGLFLHKNEAGAAMAVLMFIGLYVGRVWNKFCGASIAVLAGIFLFFTHSKSALNLLPVAFLLAYAVARMRSSYTAFALILAVLALLNLLTVGSVVFAPIRTLLERFLSDPTFTGRDEIWRFTLNYIPRHPLVGFGFEAFWGMPDLMAATSQESWAYGATHAHNAYLNLVATTGFLGLALALSWVVVKPFADYRRGRASGADPALTTLFLQIWIFGLCLSSLESVLFRGGDELWFMMVMAIVGLQFQAIARSKG